MTASILMSATPASPWPTPSFAARSGTWATYVPRLMMNAARLARLRANWTVGAPYTSIVNLYKNATDAFSLALTYLATGDAAKASAAYTAAMAQNTYALYRGKGQLYADYAAFVLDWCWPDLTSQQRTDLAGLLDGYQSTRKTALDTQFQLHECWFLGFHSYMLGAIAAQGESGATDRAAQMRNIFQHFMYWLDESFNDGTWSDYYYVPELMYEMFVLWEAATGQSIAANTGLTNWMFNRADFLVRNLGQTGLYDRPIEMTDQNIGASGMEANQTYYDAPNAYACAVLAEVTQQPLARWLQDLVYAQSGWQVHGVSNGQPVWCALFFDDTTITAQSPAALALDKNKHYPSMDWVTMRDGWNVGAANTDIIATLFGGRRPSAHSQTSAGHLTIWRGDTPLLVAGTPYSGSPSDNQTYYRYFSLDRNVMNFSPAGSGIPDADGSQIRSQPAGSSTAYPWSNSLIWFPNGGDSLAGSVLAYTANADEICTVMDLTKAYNPARVTSYQRTVSWVPSHKLFVIREVFALSGVDRARQHWHVRQKPVITGEVVVQGSSSAGILTANNGVLIKRDTSQAYLRVASPTSGVTVRLVGGVGYEQYIDGSSLDFATHMASFYQTAPIIAFIPPSVTGNWRIELEIDPTVSGAEIVSYIEVGADGDATHNYSRAQLAALAPVAFNTPTVQSARINAGATLKKTLSEAATVQFFDGPYDGDGAPTGNEVVPGYAMTWSSAPGGKIGIGQTGDQAATLTGLVVQAGVAVTVTDPITSFTISKNIDVTLLDPDQPGDPSMVFTP